MRKKTVIAIAAVALAGCGGLRLKETPEGNQTAESLDEAGSVHVAVLSVTPWDDIKAKLRPNLQIDEKDLRNQAVPVTFALLDKYQDILRLQAAIAPTIVKNTSTATTTTETGKADVTKTETTSSRAPGEARKTELPAALTPGAGPSIAASGVSAINSSLASRAMASFVQDIQALNAEVDNAAKRTDFTPYLMRVQVSVMPRRRHLGYDVYSNLSFFGYTGRFDPDTGVSSSRAPTAGTPFVVPLLSSDAIETAQRSQSIEMIRELGLAVDLLKGFGAAGVSASSQKDRQQALQGLDVNSVLTEGRLADNTVRVRFGAAFDPGGGFTVHPRTNTISVLVFFPRNATQTRVVSRAAWTHVVDGSVLERSQERYRQKLEPIAAQWAHLGVTVDELEEIDELPTEGNYAAFAEKMDNLLANYCKAPKDTFKSVGWTMPRTCDSSGTNRLSLEKNQLERERSYSYLWAHLLSVLPGSRFSSTMVDLPRLNPVCPVPNQLLAYVEDDSGISVALRGGKDLTADGLKAAVHWVKLGQDKPAAPPAQAASAAAAGNGKKGKGKPAADAEPKQAPEPQPLKFKSYAGALLATDMTVAGDRKSLTATFSSDRAVPLWSDAELQLAPVAVELAGCSVEPLAPPQSLVDWKVKTVFKDSVLYKLEARIPKKEKTDDKPKPSVALSVSASDLITTPTGTGTTRVTVDLGEKPKTPFALVASGGVIQTAGPAGKVELRADGAYLVKESGTVDLTLINVSDNRTVDLELKPVDEKNKLGASAAKVSLTGRRSPKA